MGRRGRKSEARERGNRSGPECERSSFDVRFENIFVQNSYE